MLVNDALEARRRGRHLAAVMLGSCACTALAGRWRIGIVALDLAAQAAGLLS